MLKHPFLLLFVIFSLVGVLVLTKQVQLPKIFSPKAGVVGVTLSILPSTIDMKPGDKTSFDLSLEASADTISAVEVSITYDSNILQITDISPTEALPQTLGKDLSQPSKAKIILLTGNGNSQVKNGVVAKIYVTAKTIGSSPLTLDHDSKVSALGKTGDVLDAVNSAQVTVNNTNETSSHQQSQPTIKGASDRVQEVITQYLTPTASQEATPAAKNIVQQYQRLVTSYIKGFINGINMNLEERAQKFMSPK